MKIEQFKKHFSSGKELIHLNSSGQSLIPDVNRDLAKNWIQRIYDEGAFCAMEAWGQTDLTRKKLAEFLGADVAEVSFFQTTASALSQAALSIPLQADDEVLTWDQEYPSNFYPWRLAVEKARAKMIQVESQKLQTPIQCILEKVTKKTKAIAISWVQYQTGSVTDLKALSDQLKGLGIWLVADVIQGAGVRPLDFHDTGFDIICGGSHKFMCSAYGAAYMITKKEHISKLQPLEVGAMTYGTPDTEKSFSIQPKMDGSRFEPGTKSLVEIVAMKATLDIFLQTGIQNIAEEASRLGNKLSAGLKDLGFEIHSTEGPIVNFSPMNKGETDQFAQKLMNGKVSFAKRGPGIRLSAHAYNYDKEIEQVLNLLS